MEQPLPTKELPQQNISFARRHGTHSAPPVTTTPPAKSSQKKHGKRPLRPPPSSLDLVWSTFGDSFDSGMSTPLTSSSHCCTIVSNFLPSGYPINLGHGLVLSAPPTQVSCDISLSLPIITLTPPLYHPLPLPLPLLLPSSLFQRGISLVQRLRDKRGITLHWILSLPRLRRSSTEVTPLISLKHNPKWVMKLLLVYSPLSIGSLELETPPRSPLHEDSLI